MAIHPYRGVMPTIAEGCFVAPSAALIGDVVLGAQSSLWFGAVVRGDVFHIRIGARTNIQDNAVVHVTTDRHATIIGDDVTIGHSVILHGCTVGNGALIGMGAIVMDRVEIGEGAFVGAGALVTEGTVIPPGMLAVGSPARVKRALSEEEKQHLRWSPPHYAQVAAEYARALGRGY